LLALTPAPPKQLLKVIEVVAVIPAAILTPKFEPPAFVPPVQLEKEIAPPVVKAEPI
jgi:hypothetical protein